MKKLTYLLPLLGLCACMPQPTYRNPKCTPIDKITVIQVRENLALVWADKIGDTSGYSPKTFYQPDDEHYLFIQKEPYQLYYPGQVIQLPKSACVRYTGSHTYVLNNEFTATTMKATIEPAEIPNPEYERLKAEMYEKAQKSSWWKRRYENNFGTE